MAKKLTKITIEDYSFEIDPDIIDDVEILEQLETTQNGGSVQLIAMTKKLIGKEEYDKIKAHFMEKHGKMRISTLSLIFTKIFESFDPKE